MGEGHSNSSDAFPATPRSPVVPLSGDEGSVVSLSEPGPGSIPVDATLDPMFSELPAQKSSESSINFGGSSYSGADIKVVAHLYSTIEVERETSQISRQLATAQYLVAGAQSLLSTGFANLAAINGKYVSYDHARRAFHEACGITLVTEENSEAVRILEGTFFRLAQGTDQSYLPWTKARVRAEKMVASYGNEVAQLQERLVVEEAVSKESSSTVTLATLQTMSVQSFREKNAVRALGHAGAKGYTRGTRTIGGSCIFTIFHEHALARLIRSMGSSSRYGERDSELSTLLPDQLPPIDVTIIFANEYGALSDIRIFGLEFVTDGAVFSIEDLLSEQTMNFVCRDADIMTARGRISIDRLQRGMHNSNDDKDISGSSLLFDNANYIKFLDKLHVRRRLKNR